MASNRFLCFGSREFDNAAVARHMLTRALRDYSDRGIDASSLTLVHGAARGADSLAAQIGDEFGLKLEAHPADWTALGKAAGHARNVEMSKTDLDFAIGLFRGVTPGSLDMLRICIDAGVPGRWATNGRTR
jgi:hypothetical protein